VCIIITINHGERILGFKEKNSDVLFLILEQREEKESRKRDKNQIILSNNSTEADSNFSDVFKGGHHDNCVT
jgi:hypothetical protein